MDLMTPEDTQRRLQLDEDELDDVVSHGHLTPFRLGQKVMYYKGEVEALVELFAIGNE